MTEPTIARTEKTQNQDVVHEATREPERYVTPPVDIYETGDGLTVVADLPGVAKDSIDVNVDNDLLTIKAAVPEHGTREASYREFELVSYYRQFRLGEKIDRSKISAAVTSGVLKLHLPFEEEVKPRRIEVKVA